MRINSNQGVPTVVVIVALSCFLDIPLVYANMYEPASVIIWDGSRVEGVNPGEGVSITKGSTVRIHKWKQNLVITINTPGAPSGLNANKPRITSPNGTTFEAPNPGYISDVTTFKKNKTDYVREEVHNACANKIIFTGLGDFVHILSVFCNS